METLTNKAISNDKLSITQLIIGSIMAGVFIGLAAYLSIICGSITDIIPLRKAIMGLVFPCGLIMIVCTGNSQLFTGNVMTMWGGVLCDKLSILSLFRNWFWVYIGNFVGSMLVFLPGSYVMADNYKELAIAIGETKMDLSILQMLILGFFCNFLVCIAVWMAMHADGCAKILFCMIPVFMFVTCGFEHSVANFTYLGLALSLGGGNCGAAMLNLLFVTLGNVAGGIFVAGMYGLVEKED